MKDNGDDGERCSSYDSDGSCGGEGENGSDGCDDGNGAMLEAALVVEQRLRKGERKEKKKRRIRDMGEG